MAVSILTLACLSYGSSTSLERQSAALFWAPRYPLKGNVIFCKLQIPIFSLCYWCSSHLETLPVVCGHCHTMISASKEVIIVPLCNCIIYSISFLFSGTPFSLCVHKGIREKGYWKFPCIMCSCESCAPHASSEASVHTMYHSVGSG